MLDKETGGNGKQAKRPPHPWPQRLKLARLKLELSMRELARQAGVAATTVWKLEHGHGGVGVFLKVCWALGVHPMTIMWRPV